MYSRIEINKAAFESNAALYRSIVGKKNLALVLKSNAYGHGLQLMGSLAQENNNIQWLLVAHLHEAVTLRIDGITKPILVLNPIRSDFDRVVAHNVSIMLTDLDTLSALNAAAAIRNTQVRVHIKLDTGLSRFGFEPDKVIEILQTVAYYKHIFVEGLYTHFAESNSIDLTYTHSQNDLFSHAIDACIQAGFVIPVIHSSNTAGTTSVIHHPAVNLFRLGAGIYGLEPSHAAMTANWLPEIEQRPLALLTWKTNICHIKTVPKGTPVGYNRTLIAPRDTKIGIIPVGYYDGLNKGLSNIGRVKIRKHYAPIIGLVSMNATMIDITDISEVLLDDEVVLISSDPAINARYHALLTGCNNSRQITCALNSEIERIAT